MDISYSFVPEQPAIMMTDNVGYHSSAAGVSVVPALNPAYTKSSEPDHLYEEFPEDVTIEKETSTIESGADKGDGYYNVNNELQPEGPTNDPRRRENNDDKYYENNNLFSEGANPTQTSDKMKMKRIMKDRVEHNPLDEPKRRITLTRAEMTSQDQWIWKERKTIEKKTDSILDEDEYLNMEGNKIVT